MTKKITLKLRSDSEAGNQPYFISTSVELHTKILVYTQNHLTLLLNDAPVYMSISYLLKVNQVKSELMF